MDGSCAVRVGFLYPRTAGRTAELTAAAQDRVKRGLSILVFPEGHRTRDMKVGPFKRGVFFMARDANIPVVPLAVHGIHQVNQAVSTRSHRATSQSMSAHS